MTGRCTPFVNHETNSNMDFNDWMNLEDESGLAEQDWSVEEYLSDEEFIASIREFLAKVGYKSKDLFDQ